MVTWIPLLVNIRSYQWGTERDQPISGNLGLQQATHALKVVQTIDIGNATRI